MLNNDVRSAKSRDYSKFNAIAGGHQLQDFHSVEEIYFFMETMF